MTNRRVVFVQPSLPAFRVPFYETLQRGLRSHSIDLEVVVGQPAAERQARGDQRETAFSRSAKTLRRRVGSIDFTYKPAARRVRADLIVVEHGSTVLENYLLLSRKLPNVALWGHGLPFVSSGSPIDLRLEAWQASRARHIFAYTERGRDGLIRKGVAAEKVTTVVNSTDTVRLQKHLKDAVSDLAGLRRAYRLEGKRVAMFVGGLDSSKRVPFLLDTVAQIAAGEPDFVLLFVGTGSEAKLVEQAAARGLPVCALGFGDERKVAEVAALSEMILMPGRVGLVAVDSFALGRPIFTTSHPSHAPEFDYLRPGHDAVVAPNSVGAYAAAIQRYLNDNSGLKSLQDACAERASDFTVESMSANFIRGILKSI